MFGLRFFKLKPPSEVDFLLRLLGTTDLLQLAGMFAEARDLFGDVRLMDAVNARMQELIARTAKGSRA